MIDQVQQPSRADFDRVIMMGWEDRTSFDASRRQFGMTSLDVIKLMQPEMRPSSHRMWRSREPGRVTKHEAKFAEIESGHEFRRFRAKSQRG